MTSSSANSRDRIDWQVPGERASRSLKLSNKRNNESKGQIVLCFESALDRRTWESMRLHTHKQGGGQSQKQGGAASLLDNCWGGIRGVAIFRLRQWEGEEEGLFQKEQGLRKRIV